ncbi:flagellar hook-basal body complex protein FliE [Jatrophihabitans endophyticus]|uniref:Flagellar hook-basal body complex protein FliE n=1 Tax=Jatrophihabitans endophyticus TaxID=1206085 RepID=A0A1M5IF46_9ACTN|nr:flagellar hook-basal body complex protein FliE [Jatrophihabitans endophyticus]SHG26867.1 flagellar hook-basal body complex protein FliE [Jatrophihabitans endophyticus]
MTTPIGAIAPISSLGSLGSVGSVAPSGETAAAAGSGGSDFAAQLGKGLDAVSGAQNSADSLAVQAATGQNVDPAAITVAATQAQLMTQLAASVQSKAVAAFNTIMGMQA